MSSLETKREQFSAFYVIAHPLKANVIDISSDEIAYTQSQFEDNMPYAFKMAGEMAQIQSKTLKPLRGLGEKLEDLVSYLQFQAQKIDLMMSYILQQQDEPEFRADAVKFGGGGCVIASTHDVGLGCSKAIKLFLSAEAAAIYAYGEAIESVQSQNGWEVSYVFTHIREQDQELLVRASLHLQTQALRAFHASKDS